MDYMLEQKLVGNALIAQSGGPTAVINASLVAAVNEARQHRKLITNIYGSFNACEGLLEKDNSGLTDLSAQKSKELERVASTPSSALYSSRKKVALLADEKGKVIPVREIIGSLQRLGVRYFFYIGGNDSADNCRQISEEAEKQAYELRAFHIPKTIDNDLLENDHTPGYGSAANFVACATIGDDLDNVSLPGVKINVTMGRHAGFLVASSALASARECSRAGDGPHLIYFPERTFEIEKFLQDVAKVYRKNKRALVMVSEGITSADRIPIGFNGKHDSHGNAELDGLLVAQRLMKAIAESGITTRVRADVLGYAQRSFPNARSEVDFGEALLVGREAVKAAISEQYSSGSISLGRTEEKIYRVYTKVVDLKSVARNTRKMPDKFINAEGNYVTPAFIEYAMPLVGELPRTGRIERIPINP